MQHLDQHQTQSSAKVRTSMADVLAQIIDIAASESVGMATTGKKQQMISGGPGLIKFPLVLFERSIGPGNSKCDRSAFANLNKNGRRWG